MFEYIRSHTKLLMALLLLLILPSFVLFGLEGYSGLREGTEAVARVAGQKITRSEWDEAHRREIERIRQSAPGIDLAMLDSPQARYGTLESMVRDRVLAVAAKKEHLTISDVRLATELQNNPAIASLRGPDGKLDVDSYKRLLSAQGLSPEMFEASVRADLSAQQVLRSVGGTALVSAAQADLVLDTFLEQREVQLRLFKPADYLARVKPTEADIEKHYQDNASLFQAREQASIEYLVLDLDAVKKSVAPSDDEIKAYYEQNAKALGAKEERRASHILITAPKDAPAAQRDQARARANELLAAVRKAPESFADVARKNSQDPGSAANGGDLDFFARGAMVKPFEDTAFALTKGAVSDVVETEFGFHIIRLTDIKTPPQPTLTELRPKIEETLRIQMAQVKYSELADIFTNGVYEQADSLAPTAQRLKLEVRTTSGLGRIPATGAQGPLANPKFLQALFSADALERKRNTEAIEFGPSQMVSGRIVQHVPARTLPLAEVRAQVLTSLQQRQAAALAREEGQAKLKAWQEAPASAELGAPQLLARDRPGQNPQAVLNAVLRADATKLPALLGVDLGEQGYLLAKVLRAVPRPPIPEATRQQDRGQVTRWWSEVEARSYYDLLKARYKAEILASAPEAK